MQVSEDGTTWYELAGSNYYNDNFTYNAPSSGFSKAYSGTLRNTSVVYTKGSSRVSAKLGSLNAVEVCPAAWFRCLRTLLLLTAIQLAAHIAQAVSP